MKLNFHCLYYIAIERYHLHVHICFTVKPCLECKIGETLHSVAAYTYMYTVYVH